MGNFLYAFMAHARESDRRCRVKNAIKGMMICHKKCKREQNSLSQLYFDFSW